MSRDETRTSSVPQAPQAGRRRLFAGAGAVGALAAVAAALPASRPSGATPASADVAQAKPATSGGYQLTPHVQRYYQTAKV